MVCLTTMEQSSEVLQKIYTTKMFSDITLVAGEEGKKIQAHKLVLVAALEYFEMMLSGSFKEATDSEVKIENIDSDILEAVIKFLYLGVVEIPDMKTAKELFKVSHLMKISALQEHTENYMLENIAPDNCLGMISFAKSYELQKMVLASANFAVQKSLDVIKTDEFKNLCKEEMLYYTILLKNKIKVNHLAHAIYDWIISDESRRSLSFMELLNLTDLTLIKDKDIILKLHSSCIDSENTKHMVETIYQLRFENIFNHDTLLILYYENLFFYNITKDQFVGSEKIEEEGDVVGVWQRKIVMIHSEGDNRTVQTLDLQRNQTITVGIYCVKDFFLERTKLFNGFLYLFANTFYLEVDLKTGAFKNVTSDGFNFESCEFFKNQLYFLVSNLSDPYTRWLTTKQDNWKRFAGVYTTSHQFGKLVVHGKRLYLFDDFKVLVYNAEEDKWTEQLKYEFGCVPQLISIKNKLLVIYNQTVYEYSGGSQKIFKTKRNTLMKDWRRDWKLLSCN